MDAVVAVVNNLGPEGVVDLVVNERRSVDYEFIEGAVWNSGWLGAAFVTERGKNIARQEDVAVVLLECGIDTPQQAFAGIQRMAEQGMMHVAIITPAISEEALQVFTQVHLQGSVKFVLVRSPFANEERMAALHDISALTGARLLYDVGEFMNVTSADVGFARRMWATSIKFGVISGRHQADALRGRIAAVRQAIAGFTDKKHWEELKKLRLRLAQLTGGLATLLVGGPVKTIAQTRLEHAERIIQVLQGAVDRGVVPGGGAALLACAQAVEKLALDTVDVDEQFGIRCVGQALSVPMLTIVHNAGFDSSSILAKVKLEPTGYGYDVRAEKIAEMSKSGIVDSFAVVERALQTAASVSIMTLTTTCVIHQKGNYPGVPTP